MTGYAFAVGDCWSCGRLFAFDPERVPSIPVDGVRQPVCRTCVAAANALRRESGADPIVVLPGAYVDE